MLPASSQESNAMAKKGSAEQRFEITALKL
jgi:hypothetical protein